MSSFFVETSDGRRLHGMEFGDGPPIVFLHGFPDFWRGWRRQLEALAGAFTVIAPDGRGYNLSDRPADVGSYRLEQLECDVGRVIEARAGNVKPLLVGHDWGGAVAWSYACNNPDSLAGLAILCAPHPAVLQRALTDDAAQRAASAYMARLRGPEAEGLLLDENAARLRGMLDRLKRLGLSDDEDEAAYMAAWTQQGALTGALNWYRANPMDGDPQPYPSPLENLPVMVLWGADDGALLPALAERHRPLAPRMTLEIFEGAGHWLQRERPDAVSDRIAAFAARVFSAPALRGAG